MIEHVKLYFPYLTVSGEPFLELHIGADGVKKAFFDKEDKDTLVVMTDDGIATYKGFVFVCIKAYKKEA